MRAPPAGDAMRHVAHVSSCPHDSTPAGRSTTHRCWFAGDVSQHDLHLLTATMLCWHSARLVSRLVSSRAVQLLSRIQRRRLQRGWWCWLVGARVARAVSRCHERHQKLATGSQALHTQAEALHALRLSSARAGQAEACRRTQAVATGATQALARQRRRACARTMFGRLRVAVERGSAARARACWAAQGRACFQCRKHVCVCVCVSGGVFCFI